MDFADLTDDLLDYPFFLDPYEDHPATLRGYLEEYGEDLESATYTVEEKDSGEKYLEQFIAWTEDSVLFLNYDLFNARYVAKIPRNPTK